MHVAIGRGVRTDLTNSTPSHRIATHSLLQPLHVAAIGQMGGTIMVAHAGHVSG